jgi:hypothetical protein
MKSLIFGSAAAAILAVGCTSSGTAERNALDGAAAGAVAGEVIAGDVPARARLIAPPSAARWSDVRAPMIASAAPRNAAIVAMTTTLGAITIPTRAPATHGGKTASAAPMAAAVRRPTV